MTTFRIASLLICILHSGTSISSQPLEEASPTDNSKYKREINWSGCGKINLPDPKTTTASKISEATSRGEFPWMIEVRDRRGNTTSSLCGGSLIRPGVVLTAAHCLYSEEITLAVRAGVWNKSEDSTEDYQEREVVRILKHEDHHKPWLANDVALLFLDKPFQLSEAVGTVCLPEKDDRTYASCLATGWGRNHLGVDLNPTLLRKVDLPLVPRDECYEKVKKYVQNRKNFTFHESFLCAGGVELKGTCQGDGGGPLVCPSNDRYVQIGIVSWGVGCGLAIPGVFASVQYLLPWIAKNVDTPNP